MSYSSLTIFDIADKICAIHEEIKDLPENKGVNTFDKTMEGYFKSWGQNNGYETPGLFKSVISTIVKNRKKLSNGKKLKQETESPILKRPVYKQLRIHY